MNDLWAALAMLFIIEGLLPFLSPKGYKDMVQKISEADEKQIRLWGLLAMFIGVVSLYFIRN